MENENKLKVYFDYNIFEHYEEKFANVGSAFLDKINIFCSVAHVEEYYKALCNCWKNREQMVKNVNRCKQTRSVIERLTKNFILNPSNNRESVICLKEVDFDDCMEWVKFYDTRDLVNRSAEINCEYYADSVNGLQDKEKSVLNNSKLSYENIWNREEVISRLNYWNDRIIKGRDCQVLTDSEILFAVRQWRNMSIYGRALFLEYLNIPHLSFLLKKECLEKNLHSFHELETVIELLNDVLCSCGYNKDKNSKKHKSGATHDVSHMVYATYCDCFVTDDEPLQKRAQAIYWFSGISTKVMSLDEFKEKYLS